MKFSLKANSKHVRCVLNLALKQCQLILRWYLLVSGLGIGMGTRHQNSEFITSAESVQFVAAVEGTTSAAIG